MRCKCNFQNLPKEASWVLRVNAMIVSSSVNVIPSSVQLLRNKPYNKPDQ